MAADFEKAKAKAAEILEEYAFVRPPIDPEIFARKIGVDVVYADFNPEVRDEFSGFIRFNEKNDDAPQIIVNKAINANQMTFTIAHELAHYLLHREYAKSNDYQVMPRNNFYPEGRSKEEKEADCFAANLLVPENMLRKYSAYSSVGSIEQLAKMFAVPKDVILDRMRSLGI